MLGFELPPTDIVAVEYIGLSQQSDVAEAQKDLLRQFLGEVVPHGKELVDTTELSGAAQHSGLFVRCVQCDLRPDKAPATIRLAGEDKSAAASAKANRQFKLALNSGEKSAQTWVVEVGPRKSAWFASLNPESLSSKNRLTPADFQFNTCIEGLSCPTVPLFLSKSECAQWTNQFVGKRVDFNAVRTGSRREKILSPDKVPYLMDVRPQSTVRAVMSTSGSSLRIKVSARALKAGTLGDLIPIEIQNTSTLNNKSKQLEARIVSEGEVEIVR